MKILHYTNVIFYLTTLSVYIFCDVAAGLVFQFFFGIIQLLYFLISNNRVKSESIKKHLRLYIALVGLTFLALAILFNISPYAPTLPIIVLIGLPMSIATYFVYITYLIQKQ